MKKVFLAATATVALMTIAGAAQAQSADWTGAYVGLVAGYADRSENASETILFDTNLNG